MDKGAETLYQGRQRRRFYGIPFNDHPPNLHNYYLRTPYHCNGKSKNSTHLSQQNSIQKKPYYIGYIDHFLTIDNTYLPTVH